MILMHVVNAFHFTGTSACPKAMCGDPEKIFDSISQYEDNMR